MSGVRTNLWFLSIVVAIGLLPLSAQAPRVPAPLDIDEIALWRQDLAALDTIVSRYHREPWHAVSPEVFHAQLGELSRQLPTLSLPKLLGRLAQLMATIGDGHTGLAFTDPRLGMESVPLRFGVHPDGVFIQAAAPEVRRLVGAEVRRIGGHPVAEVLGAVREAISGSSPSERGAFLHFRLARPAFLFGIGMADRADSLELVLRLAGGVDTLVTLGTMGRRADGGAISGGIGYTPGAVDGSGWIDAQPPGEKPLWLRTTSGPFWTANLPDLKAVYVGIRQIGDTETERLETFVRRVVTAAAAEPGVDRVVIDLRLNGGGDNTLLPPVMRVIAGSRFAVARGGVFVLTSSLTQSAAQNFVNLLERYANAIIVGEPTGERPNHYGEGVRFLLPHHGVSVGLSTQWWQDLDPRDERDATDPDVAAPLLFSDYRRGRDPALAAIGERDWSVSWEDAIDRVLATAPSAADTAWSAFRRDPWRRMLNPQRGLEDLLDRRLTAGDSGGVRRVAGWMVTLTPDNPVARVALADLQLTTGDTVGALHHLRVAEARHPRNAEVGRRIRALVTAP